MRVIEDKSRSSKVAPGEHASSLNFWSEDGFYAHPLALYDASNRLKERRSEKRNSRNVETMKVMQIENELGSKDDLKIQPVFP